MGLQKSRKRSTVSPLPGLARQFKGREGPWGVGTPPRFEAARPRPHLAGEKKIARRRSKPAPRRSETHRVDRRIRVREVRVIDADGTQLGIISTQDAIARAQEQGLQLVEVNPKTNPPVCKILDYGKFKYETAKREREGKKGKRSQEMKEVKFRPKIGDHDFNFKLKHARRFLDEGNKVRLLVQFRGREVVHPETGRAVLDRVCKETNDLATIVQVARMEGNRMSMILGPKAKRNQPAAKPKADKPGDEEKASAAEAPPKKEAPESAPAENAADA